jgi:hypothetical protein
VKIATFATPLDEKAACIFSFMNLTVFDKLESLLRLGNPSFRLFQYHSFVNQILFRKKIAQI